MVSVYQASVYVLVPCCARLDKLHIRDTHRVVELVQRTGDAVVTNLACGCPIVAMARRAS